jgi:hypothetical protein
LEENFDRFNIAIYKEKEMVDFRRWITALAVLALFTGLASAQVGGIGPGGALTCTATVAVPPALRAEGMTELIGDIVLQCTGGSALAAGSVIPTANITVSLGTNVTSRLLPHSSLAAASEALLLVDEPNSGLPALVAGYGPGAPLSLCGTVTVGAGPGGCLQYVNYLNAAGAADPAGFPVAVTASGGTTAAQNVFQGWVNGNQVVFNGIPILPPVTAGSARVFRITNVRANVAGLGGGGLPGTTQLLASVSISGSTSVPISNPTPIAGFIQSGLNVTFRNAANSGGLSSGGAGRNQCQSANLVGIATLVYNETFGTSFKTRVAPTAAYNGQSGSPTQNVPGTIYNSESGFVFGPTAGGQTAGLADYGTRLKAVFNNVPAGVRIFVSVTNLLANTSSPNTAAPAGNATNSYAVLVNGEASPDANGFPPTLAPTASVNSGNTGVFEVPLSGGSGMAVWEVINTNPANIEFGTDPTAGTGFKFGVWVSYSANPGSNSPPPGTATVNASFAPTPPGPFSASAGSQASASLTIPRFADTSTARNLLVIDICQTLLLFPFVTNQSGVDTGIAIANTTSDPVGTGAQAGTCRLTFYDGTGNTPAVTRPSVATGTVDAFLISGVASGFQGYMFALCNFQYAHGFAFISDLGARNLAMGYLALVVNNGTASARGPASESLGN